MIWKFFIGISENLRIVIDYGVLVVNEIIGGCGLRKLVEIEIIVMIDII